MSFSEPSTLSPLFFYPVVKDLIHNFKTKVYLSCICVEYIWCMK